MCENVLKRKDNTRRLSEVMVRKLFENYACSCKQSNSANFKHNLLEYTNPLQSF